MENTPLVSIVLTLYNKEKYILEQLESIKNQSYTHWELIIVDDASTDASATIVNSFISVNPSLDIQYIKNPKNLHVSKTFQRWLSNIRWVYVAMCDADDLWLSSKLEKQIVYLESHPNIGLVYHDLYTCDESLSIINHSFIGSNNTYIMNHDVQYEFRSLLNTNYITATTIVFRSKYKNTTFSSYCNAQDWWIALIVSGAHGKVWFLDESLVKYRRYGGSLSSWDSQTRKELVSLFFQKDWKAQLFSTASKHWKEQHDWIPELRAQVLPEFFDILDARRDTLSRLIDSFSGKASKISNILYFSRKKMWKEAVTLIYFWNISL